MKGLLLSLVINSRGFVGWGLGLFLWLEIPDFGRCRAESNSTNRACRTRIFFDVYSQSDIPAGPGLP